MFATPLRISWSSKSENSSEFVSGAGGLDDMFGLNFTFFAARAGGTEVGPGSGTRARGVFARG